MMNMHLEKLEYFRGDQLEKLNTESPEPARAPDGAASPVGRPEAAKDTAEDPREEEIDLWMKNIREFIRGIDVKAL